MREGEREREEAHGLGEVVEVDVGEAEEVVAGEAPDARHRRRSHSFLRPCPISIRLPTAYATLCYAMRASFLFRWVVRAWVVRPANLKKAYYL